MPTRCRLVLMPNGGGDAFQAVEPLVLGANYQRPRGAILRIYRISFVTIRL